METRGGHSAFLPNIFERSSRADRLRRRCATFAAALLFVFGFLAALDSTLLVWAALGVLVLAAAVLVVHERCACMNALRRSSPYVHEVALLLRRLRHAFVRAPALIRTAAFDARRTERIDGAGWPLPPSTVSKAADDEVTADLKAVAPLVIRLVPAARQLSGRSASAARRRAAAKLSELLPKAERREGGMIAGSRGAAEDALGGADVEGLRCNALGLALRRAGRTQQAAALHEAALLIFARLGDRRAEALTANALGVALTEAGDQAAALEQFERARGLLHEVGDREWEGKVLANIALAKLRVGCDEEALELLRTALTHLAPETEAYERVERRLRLAS